MGVGETINLWDSVSVCVWYEKLCANKEAKVSATNSKNGGGAGGGDNNGNDLEK